MTDLKKSITDWFSKYGVLIILCISATISVFSFLYYFEFMGKLNVQYYDAQSRLNIARKITDNLSPGLAQLGNVWLPLPQMIMMPFVTNDYLWHSGIAGYIMSFGAFMALIYFVYKFGEVVLESKGAGIFMSILALSNINMLYMQTTPMTEIFFTTTVMGATYFIARWSKEHNINHMLMGAVMVSMATLIRYEGYALFVIATAVVFLTKFVEKRRMKSAEGPTVLFATLAATGIFLWTIYCWAIFKDPLYWMKIYSHEVSIITNDDIKKSLLDSGVQVIQKKDLFYSVVSYIQSSAMMNGIILTFLSGAGFVLFSLRAVWKSKIARNPDLFSYFIPLSVFLFVVYSLYRGSIPLIQPEWTLNNFLSKSTSLQEEYNIRYGLEMFPFVAIFVGWLLSRKSHVIKMFVWIVFLFQFVTQFWTPIFTVYSLPAQLSEGVVTTEETKIRGNTPASNFLKQQYDGGLILISALKYDPEMFYLGLPYKTYIHEGAGKYWMIAKEDPQKLARWVFMTDYNTDSDSVRKYLGNSPVLDQYYDKVYEDRTYVIYKIKTNFEKQVEKI